MPTRLEQLGAKGAGAIKGLAGAIKGLNGVFNTLVQQHGEVAVLLERTKLSKDSAKRAEMWATIREELLSHERGELDVVYPAFSRYAQLASIAEAHAGEASELESRIRELDGLGTGSEAWVSGFEQLVALVKQHVEAEEHDWFPKASAAFSKEESEALDQQFKARKRAAAEQI